jgi:hypothetical protein
MLNIKIRYLKSSLVIILSLLLLFGFPGLIKETIINISAQASGATYGNRVGVIIPMATCSTPQSCSACINCRCGNWDDLTVLPVFGGAGVVATYACKMATFTPWGGGQCQVNEVIMGQAASEILSANSGKTTIWCQMQ